jgi:subtilase family serine protease
MLMALRYTQALPEASKVKLRLCNQGDTRMTTRKVGSVLAPLIFILSLAPLAAGAARPGSFASPFLKMGPKAIPADAANASYGLFSCQLVGSTPTCYDPYQIRHAYNTDALIAAGFDGRGRTIVIVDAFQSPNIVSQLNTYNAFYGLPGLNGLGAPHDATLANFTQVAPNGLTPFVVGDPDMTGWAEEISLDVTWAHAIAPGANIVLVLAKSDADADLLSATKYAVDHNLGDIISQSFGENESCMDPKLAAQEHQVFSAATLKNITLFASTGDEGAAQLSCDQSTYVKAASSPASDPLVTAVGGTELHAAGYCLAAVGCNPAVNPAPGTYQGEIAWNEFGSSAATGGGFSVLFDEPSFQQGVVHGGKQQRGLPDVSYSAAVEHGVLTYLDIPGLEVGFYLFGGTSAGSPQWAAILAIADQKAGYDLGFINRAIYTIAQSHKLYSASFFDITSGNNSVVEDVAIKGFNAGPGWDATTGLGSPTVDQLTKRLLQLVTPLDGLLAVLESSPHSICTRSGHWQMNPH